LDGETGVPMTNTPPYLGFCPAGTSDVIPGLVCPSDAAEVAGCDDVDETGVDAAGCDDVDETGDVAAGCDVPGDVVVGVSFVPQALSSNTTPNITASNK